MITLWMSNTLHYLSPSSIWLGNTTSAQDVWGTDQWQLMISNILHTFMNQYIALHLILKAQGFYGLRWSFKVFRSTNFNAQMWQMWPRDGPAGKWSETGLRNLVKMSLMDPPWWPKGIVEPPLNINAISLVSMQYILKASITMITLFKSIVALL